MSRPLALRHRLGGYREYAPPGAAAAFAENVWVFRAPPEAGASDRMAHRVLPDPALSLAFYRSPGAPSRLVLIGPKTRPRVYAPVPGTEVGAVRIKLEWVEPLLGVAPGDHRDAEEDLAAILPDLAEPLLEDLAAAPDSGSIALALAAALARRRGAGPSPAAERALDLVRRAVGGEVEAIADAVGVSSRHLRRVVRRDAGVSLKAYARALRFLRAVMLADRAARPAWARIAAAAGFCDQSHLVRECRALTGLAPGAMHGERRLESETSKTAARRVG